MHVAEPRRVVASAAGRGQPPVGAPRCPFLRRLFGVYSVFIRRLFGIFSVAEHRVRTRPLARIRVSSAPPPTRSVRTPRAGHGCPAAPAWLAGGRRRNPKSACPCENRRRINGESIPNKYRTNRTDRAVVPSTGDGGSRPISQISHEIRLRGHPEPDEGRRRCSTRPRDPSTGSG